ncbi:MAG: hypothetical protein HFG27_08625 [Provencibacterium sp.]|jgi:hypothetical protein|nr:hypothetical protein [Provencibacterium sp.]
MESPTPVRIKQYADGGWQPLSMCADAAGVALSSGGTLADWEPVHLLCTLSHSLDGYPYPVLVGERDGTAVLLPAGVKYLSRWEMEIYVPAAWASTVELRQRTENIYDAIQPVGTVHIRLI